MRWCGAAMSLTLSLSLTACALMRPTVEVSEMELMEELDRIFQAFDGENVPGACVGVFRDGEIALVRSYGLAQVEERIPCEPQTNFRLASVTKQFTAMAVLICRERGLLSLDDPITRFFPDFPEIGEQITVRRLLNHTSGMVAYEDLIPEDQTEQVHDRDVLALVETQHGTYFTPGSQYRYSNSGYALLAMIVEEVSGQRFAEFLRDNIFLPLGMENTVALEEGISEVPHRAHGYRETDEGDFESRDQSVTSAVLGDGGIYTSVLDFAKWDEALCGETLVSRESIEEAFTSGVLTDGTETGYGFGWRFEERNGVRVIYHNGSTCGFSTAMRHVPERHLGLVVLTNRNSGGAGGLADEILALLLR
ncbi:beta-lactamase family protein [Candidatus Sumerlaeota bacterium]|nr:beta-lactamase family protein [Candidatus Sumerlaeota bacterium]